MATTTNYGWTTPDDTALVKDGAAAIRSLGSAIDTSMMDLKGGTTGQSLTKNSNTDMDFVWATPAAGGLTSIASGSLSGSAVNLTSISGSYKNLQLVLRGLSMSTGAFLWIRFNNDSGSNYGSAYVTHSSSTTNTGGNDATSSIGVTYNQPTAASTNNHFVFNIYDYTQTNGSHIAAYYANYQESGAIRSTNGVGTYQSLSAISQINIIPSTGTFDAGTYTLYGVN